jgi:SAM-dependent methyltransferase
MANEINVQTIMQEIRQRIRQSSAPPQLVADGEVFSGAPLPDIGPLETAAPALPDMLPLEAAVHSLHLKSLVGELPPQPPSLRGSLGSLLVKAVRKMLFWYTPQIRDFQAGAVAAFDAQLAGLRSVASATQQEGRLLAGVANRLEKLEQNLELEQALEAETRAREHLAQRLEAEVRAREHLVQRLEAERAARASIEQALSAETRTREHLVECLEAETAAREQLASHLAEERGAREALSVAMAEKSRPVDIAIQQLRAEISHQHARISILLEDVRKKTAVVSGEPQPVKLSEEDSHALDGLYMALEDRFRGSRAEIEERLRFYLPLLAKHQIGTQRMPVLDIGCGRGEWLEVLSEANLDAYGVDTNRIFVAACKEKGLRVTEEDALQHLRGLPDNRLGAVTGFHIIEHLPLDVLIKVIDETVRVLKPGGLAIFETPNPQNVLVGSHNFYIDPTHRDPIPCLTAQFLLEARGLCDVEILQLHPYAEAYKVPDGGTELARRFNDYFYGPQDYAVIGRRV